MTSSARRQYGEGNISGYLTKKGMRYRCQWYERDPSTGKNRRQQKAGFATKRDAARFLRERSVDAQRGSAPALHSPTVGDYLDDWLSRHRAAASTLAGYRRLSRLHVVPHLGTVSIGDLTPGHLARLYRTLENKPLGTPGRQDRTLGPSTIRKVHQLLSVVLSAAVEDGYLAVNAARMKAAQPPTTREVENRKPRITVWEPSTLLSFYGWAKLYDPELCLTWRTIGDTGMRRGEALALSWQDVDLKRQALTVRRALVTVKNHGQRARHIMQLPKNSRPRTIAISRELAAALAAEHERQTSRGLAAPTSPVLVNESGRQLLPESLSRRWRQAVLTFTSLYPDAPVIPLHGLRHTHASHLLAAGVGPKIVQVRLGHETFKLTMDTYSHLLEDSQQQAVSLLQDFQQAIEAKAPNRGRT